VTASLLLLLLVANGSSGHAAGFATLSEDDLFEHVAFLASPELEGRDTPSAGLERAADYIAEAFRALELEDLPGETAGFRRTYVQDRSFAGAPLLVTVSGRCRLELRENEDAAPVPLVLGADFVPVPGCIGDSEGEPMFLGFGIDSDKHPYNDLKGSAWRGKIAVILEGEPRHRRLLAALRGTGRHARGQPVPEARDAR
jgi:hypothetical protein